jgi:uncharacterized protein (TIGR03083 family)
MDPRSQQLCDEAETARGAVLALVTGLTAEQFRRPTASDGWSVKDTLAHLASIEARVRLMLWTVLEGGTWSADRADLDAYNARCVEERRSWSANAVLDELRETGRATADLLSGLTPDQLDREWEHPIFGPMTIERTAGIVARHLRAHTAELCAALEA